MRFRPLLIHRTSPLSISEKLNILKFYRCSPLYHTLIKIFTNINGTIIIRRWWKFDSTRLDISPWRGSMARNRRKSLWGLTVNTSPLSSTPFSPIVSAPFGSSNPFNRSKIAGLQRFTWSSSNHVPFLRHWNAKIRSSQLRFVHKFSREFFFGFFFFFFFFLAIFKTRRFFYYWDSFLDRSCLRW